MVDLEDYDEVVNAIGKLDKSGQFSTGLSNLMTSISWLRNDNEWSKYSHTVDEITDVVEKLAVESYLLLMENRKDLAADKAEELFAKMQRIGVEDIKAKEEIRKQYLKYEARASELDKECERISDFQDQQIADVMNAPFNH